MGQAVRRLSRGAKSPFRSRSGTLRPPVFGPAKTVRGIVVFVFGDGYLYSLMELGWNVDVSRPLLWVLKFDAAGADGLGQLFES
jgi:hypothetical protein